MMKAQSDPTKYSGKPGHGLLAGLNSIYYSVVDR
jgi:hypothetical protein